MPMSRMQGSSAMAQQSQSTERFFITLIYAAFPLKSSVTDIAASAIASQKPSCEAQLSQRTSWSVTFPPEWIRHLPAVDAQPIESCLSAPP